MRILQLPEHDELLWDDGSGQPEHCLDQFPMVPKVCMFVCNCTFCENASSPFALDHVFLSETLQHVLAALQYEALGFLLGGLGFYYLLGQLAKFNDKASKKPYVRSRLSAILLVVDLCIFLASLRHSLCKHTRFS